MQPDRTSHLVSQEKGKRISLERFDRADVPRRAVLECRNSVPDHRCMKHWLTSQSLIVSIRLISTPAWLARFLSLAISADRQTILSAIHGAGYRSPDTGQIQCIRG